MPGKQGMVVREYLTQLKATRKGKPAQIKEALDVYIELWDKAVGNGTVTEGDEIVAALSKIDKAGGLYQAAEQGLNP
jgi:uncharacterized membrane protein